MASVGDAFDRALLGGNWTQILSGAGTSDLIIDTERVRATTAATAAAAYYNAVTPGSNCWASCRIAGVFGGPLVRSTGDVAGGNWSNYEAYNNTTTNIRIARHLNNSPSTLINFPAPWSGIANTVDGDELRLEALGNLLRVYLNVTFIGQVVNTLFLTGSCGLITHDGINSFLDNFQAGDLELGTPGGWGSQYQVAGGRRSILVPSGMGN